MRGGARTLFAVLIILAPFLFADHAAAAETKLRLGAPSPRVVAAATAVQSLPSRPDDFTLRTELPSVHFDFNKSELRPADRKILDANAEWLKAHPEYAVLIEGGADPRGTRDYNLDLAQKRAAIVKDYLGARGVSPDRIMIMTSGELRRACGAMDEVCWSLDRRADLLVLLKTMLGQAP